MGTSSGVSPPKWPSSDITTSDRPYPHTHQLLLTNINKLIAIEAITIVCSPTMTPAQQHSSYTAISCSVFSIRRWMDCRHLEISSHPHSLSNSKAAFFRPSISTMALISALAVPEDCKMTKIPELQALLHSFHLDLNLVLTLLWGALFEPLQSTTSPRRWPSSWLWLQ